MTPVESREHAGRLETMSEQQEHPAWEHLRDLAAPSLAEGGDGGVAMATYITVRRVRGPAWDRALPMRAQALWAEHAAFMNALAAEGFVVLGGPLGSGEEVLLVIDSASEDAVRARLAADPWSGAGLLDIGRVEPWTVLLDSRSA